jgi:hypothetical protein
MHGLYSSSAGAPSFVRRSRTKGGRPSSCINPFTKASDPAHTPPFAEPIKSIAAPSPFLRIRHQPSRHRIEMDIVEFFISLLLAPHIEIIETAVPEPPRTRSGRFIVLLAQLARNSLFQNLNRRRGCPGLRLSHQQMDVLRHDSVAGQKKPAPRAGFVENPQEHIACVCGFQQREALITTESNEVKVMFPVAALQTLRHRNKFKTSRPLPTAQRTGHPWV